MIMVKRKDTEIRPKGKSLINTFDWTICGASFKISKNLNFRLFKITQHQFDFFTERRSRTKKYIFFWFRLISSSHFSWGQLRDGRIRHRLAGSGRDRSGGNSSEMRRIRGDVHRTRCVMDRLNDRWFSGRNGIGCRDGVTGWLSGQYRDGHAAAAGSWWNTGDPTRFLFGHLKE
jgi:hypothetical protein